MITVNLNSLGFKPEDVAVVSDLHLNHKRDFVWQARGFNSPEEHCEANLRDLEQLGPDKLLIILGDTFLNSTRDQVDAALARIKCKTLILFGNHPAGIKDTYHEAMFDLIEKFRGDGSLPLLDNKLGVRPVVFPLEILPDKYVMGDHFYFKVGRTTYYAAHFAPLIWDGMQHGVPAVVGHSHGNCKQLNPDTTDFGKIVDAGVDNALKVVGRCFFWVPELDAIFKKKGQKIWDHHDGN